MCCLIVVVMFDLFPPWLIILIVVKISFALNLWKKHSVLLLALPFPDAAKKSLSTSWTSLLSGDEQRYVNILLLFVFLMLFISVYGHSGYELRINKWKGFYVFNTSLHHFQHHEHVHYNFGIYLNIWDRLFGTYQAESIFGAENQKIGLAEIDDARPSAFIWSMKQPMT